MIEIRKFKHTEIFQTDVKQVFDFIRLSKEKEALRSLINSDEGYRNMEEDAYELLASYTTSAQLLKEIKQKQTGKGGKKDMSDAIQEMIEDGKAEGRRTVLRYFLSNGGTEEEAVKMLGVTEEDLRAVRENE